MVDKWANIIGAWGIVIALLVINIMQWTEFIKEVIKDIKERKSGEGNAKH